MAFNYSPKIITDGLIAYFDASNRKSYPGSGTSWINLTKNGGALSQGTFMPVWTTLGGVVCFNFNQIGAYFTNSNLFSISEPIDGTNLTIDVWFYPAASELSIGDRGNLVRNVNVAFYMSWNKSNQKQSNYWYGKTNEGYHESGAAITRSTWNNVVAAWSSTSLSQYLNNTKTTATTSGTNGGKTTGLEIGWEGDGRQFSGGIASIKIYNTCLTDAQVTQNYNATKSRFNLS